MVRFVQHELAPDSISSSGFLLSRRRSSSGDGCLPWRPPTPSPPPRPPPRPPPPAPRAAAARRARGSSELVVFVDIELVVVVGEPSSSHVLVVAIAAAAAILVQCVRGLVVPRRPRRPRTREPHPRRPQRRTRLLERRLHAEGGAQPCRRLDGSLQREERDPEVVVPRGGVGAHAERRGVPDRGRAQRQRIAQNCAGVLRRIAPELRPPGDGRRTSRSPRAPYRARSAPSALPPPARPPPRGDDRPSPRRGARWRERRPQARRTPRGGAARRPPHHGGDTDHRASSRARGRGRERSTRRRPPCSRSRASAAEVWGARARPRARRVCRRRCRAGRRRGPGPAPAVRRAFMHAHNWAAFCRIAQKSRACAALKCLSSIHSGTRSWCFHDGSMSTSSAPSSSPSTVKRRYVCA